MKKKIILIVLLVLIIAGLITFLLLNNNGNKDNKANDQGSSTQKEEKKEEESTVEWGDYDSNDITLDKSLKITEAGVYNLTGTIEDGYILIDTDGDVKLVLNNVNITNSNGPAILVTNANVLEIELAEDSKNYLTDGEVYSNDNADYDAVIYSKDDLILSGSGALDIKSKSYKGIVSKDTLIVNSGNYTIETEDDGINVNDIITINGGSIDIKTSGDGIHADGMIEINKGTFEIEAAEGIEATYIVINDGEIDIYGTDDGINASDKSEDYDIKIEINGGNITIKMAQGDTDGVDSNGDIIINGGYINVTGQSTFDYDGTGVINGGTVICNGQTISTLPNQFGGGQGTQQPGGGDMPQGNMPPDQGGMPSRGRY